MLPFETSSLSERRALARAALSEHNDKRDQLLLELYESGIKVRHLAVGINRSAVHVYALMRRARERRRLGWNARHIERAELVLEIQALDGDRRTAGDRLVHEAWRLAPTWRRARTTRRDVALELMLTLEGFTRSERVYD